MGEQSLEPRQFVGKLGPRLRITVGQVDGRDQDSAHSGLDVTGLVVGRISRECAARDHRSRTPRKDGDTVPGTLSPPDRAVARRLYGGDREGAILSLQLLQADHVRLRDGQPVDQVGQALVDVVDVEGRDPHPSGCRAQNGQDLGDQRRLRRQNRGVRASASVEISSFCRSQGNAARFPRPRRPLHLELTRPEG